jgi:hypothetical protein
VFPRGSTTAPARARGSAEVLQRSLYDAFHLQVRYHRPRHEVIIRVTIRADALPSLTQLMKEAAGQPGIPTGNGKPDDARSHVSGAPGRIRTCARGSGGGCSSPPLPGKTLNGDSALGAMYRRSPGSACRPGRT